MTNEFRIVQSEKYAGNDYWYWEVHLEGDLSRVKEVEYTLHETFPKPVRRIRDKQTGFKLEASGWGGFTIYARVYFDDGSSQLLTHDLQLHYPDGALSPA